MKLRTADQKVVFQEIRNHLAGRVLGVTRDQALLEEVMKCLFAYKQMILRGKINGFDDEVRLARSYRDHLSDVDLQFAEHAQILLDPAAIAFIHERFLKVDVLASDRDPVGDLYETFIGSAVRGSEGQFFTPQNAGRWIIDAIAPSAGERVIDPACGAGGFLLWSLQQSKGAAKLYGIEKDSYLASLASARTAILGTPSTVMCANSLSFESDEKGFRGSDLIETFDVVVTNPPFGKNIVSVSPKQQRQFELGYRWRKVKDRYERTTELASRTPPQLLFIERIISLLRPGGRAGLVVPESLISSRSYGHAVQYIREHSSVRAVVGMPESLFKHSGKGGTHTKTCLLLLEKGKKQGKVFMAEAKWCGHDSRGRAIPNDDLPQITEDYKAFKKKKGKLGLGYEVDQSTLESNILAPRYHEPTAQRATSHLTKSHELVSIQELIDQKVLEIRTGDEVGKLAYGTGSIPFIRTSDISGWEIKIDPKHCVSDGIYRRYAESQDVKRGDIFMVRDGTYLIGSCAIVTAYDEKIVYQSHIYKIRSLDHKKLSPYLLLALLSSEPVQKQIRSKTFTQDIIDSLGNRVGEIILPVPKKQVAKKKVEAIVEKVIADRVEARELARHAKILVVSPLLK